MRIQLFNNYGGDRTNEQRIPPGIYETDDPALFGLCEYLVQNGHARFISEEAVAKADAQRSGEDVQSNDNPSVADTSPAPNHETPEHPYEDWALVELRAEVTMRGIPNEDVPREEGRPATKANLATVLRNHDNAVPG